MYDIKKDYGVLTKDEACLLASLIGLRSTKNLNKVDGVKQFKAYYSGTVIGEMYIEKYVSLIEKGMAAAVQVGPPYYYNAIEIGITTSGVEYLEKFANLKIEIVRFDKR